MEITKDTVMYGSFSAKPGNKGCELFNRLFKEHEINAIYKSFGVSDISDAIAAAKTLKFGGFAVSMPFKVEAMKYADSIDITAEKIGAVNTFVRDSDGMYKAYNTDWVAAYHALRRTDSKHLFILGNGGYATAVAWAATKLNIGVTFITRENWDDIYQLSDSVVYNCTPVENLQYSLKSSNIFIDGITKSETGKRLSQVQALEQFQLYTGYQNDTEIWVYVSHVRGKL